MHAAVRVVLVSLLVLSARDANSNDRMLRITAIPEPATLSFVGLGAVGIARRLKRRRQGDGKGRPLGRPFFSFR